MAKTEQKACLSTLSIPHQSAPPLLSPETTGPLPPPKDTPLLPRGSRELLDGIRLGGAPNPYQKKPDYFVAFAYILIYFEVGWLILMLLRMYSRD